MVLVKRKCPPERRKATIAVKATPSSPILSVRGSAPFHLYISLRLAQTTRLDRAVIIRTDGTVFCPSRWQGEKEEGDSSSQLDTAARGTISLTSVADPSSIRKFPFFITIEGLATQA